MNRFDIGRRIGSYREKLKLSTQELANRIKRSQATISRIENGKQGITPELLVYIARELGVHPFALLTDQPLRGLNFFPAAAGSAIEITPTLLASALQTGRISQNLQIAQAAAILDIPVDEIQQIESGALQPATERLEKLCALYRLNPAEMKALSEIDQRSPNTSRRLGCLQSLITKIMHLCNQTIPGNEGKTIQDITTIITMAYAEHPHNSPATELGQIINHDPELLSTALQDQKFFSHMKDLLINQDPESRATPGS